MRLPRRQKVFVKPEAGKRLTCSKDQNFLELWNRISQACHSYRLKGLLICSQF